VAVSVSAVLSKVREEVAAKGSPCSAEADLELAEDLYLAGRLAVLKTEAGTKCLDIGEVAEALREIAAPEALRQEQAMPLSPPYIELYERGDKYVVMGVHEGKVYMTEWSGVLLCCSWSINIDLEKYKRIYKILSNYLGL
jgi:hypothetical protein